MPRDYGKKRRPFQAGGPVNDDDTDQPLTTSRIATPRLPSAPSPYEEPETTPAQPVRPAVQRPDLTQQTRQPAQIERSPVEQPAEEAPPDARQPQQPFGRRPAPSRAPKPSGMKVRGRSRFRRRRH